MVSRAELFVTNSRLGWKNRVINAAYSFRMLFFLRHVFQFFLHIYLPVSVYGNRLRMCHCYNITVNPNVKLGCNVTLYHGVTIGSKQFGSNPGVPVIGDNVVVYPNAVIVGGIFVGSGAVIGAGSVVVSDIPSNAMVAGNPGKVISYIKD